jgi:hypothetical protein
MTLGPASWCLLVGDMEIQGPVSGGRHGWPFGASIEDLAALGYVTGRSKRNHRNRDAIQDLAPSRAADHSTIISPNFAGL